MEAKTNISQPAEYLGYWEETYKNDLVNDVMPFWLKYGIDKENGGYFTCLNRDGSLMVQTNRYGSRDVSLSSWPMPTII